MKHDRPAWRGIAAAALAAAVALLPHGPRAFAQETKASESLVRAQQQVEARYQSLLAKMQRIADKLDREGRTYAANLLRRALEQAEKPEIREKLAAAKLSLEAEALFEAHQTQLDIIQFLEGILALLQDREEEEKIRDAIEKIQNALDRLDNVREREKDLLDKTRDLQSEVSKNAATDPQLEAALENLDRIVTDQEAIQQKLDAEGDTSPDSLERTFESLTSLRNDQEALRESLSGQSPASESAPLDKILEELLPLLTEQREAIESLPREPGTEEANRALAEASRTRAAKAESLAKRVAEEASAEESNGNWLTGGLYRSMEDNLRRAAESLEEGAEAAEKPEWRDVEYAQNRAIVEMEKAWNLGERIREAGASKGSEASSRQEELARRGESIARALDRLARRESGGQAAESGERKNAMERAAESVRDAQQGMEEAARGLREGKADDGLQEEIGNDLEKAADEIRGIREEETAQERESLERLKPEQEDLAQRAAEAGQDLRERSEQAASESASPFLDKASGLLDEARDFMNQASQSLEQTDRSGARSRSKLALDRLREAREEVRQAGAAPNEEQRERFRRLSRSQEEIREATDEVSEAQKAIPGNRAESRSLSQAQEAMEQAQRMLERSRGERSAELEDEAVRRLNQAERDLLEQKRQYIGLQQEELLFRLKERITRIRESEEEIHTKTVALEESRVRSGGEFTRLQKLRDLKELQIAQTDLHSSVVEISKAIEDREDSPVFVWYLEQTAMDMEAVSELLRSEDTGYYTQGLEESILEKLEGMISDLDEELDRRRDEEGDPNQQQDGEQSGGGQQSAPRLVPHVTELKMIRRMQEEVFRRREEFLRDNPAIGDGELTEIQKVVLNRILHQQGSVNEMFRKFKEKLTGSP